MEQLHKGRPTAESKGMAVIMEEVYENKEYLKLYSGLVAANKMVKDEYCELYSKLLTYISEVDTANLIVLNKQNTKIMRLYNLLIFMENPSQETLSSLLNNISSNLVGMNNQKSLESNVKEFEILNKYNSLYEQVDYTQAILDEMEGKTVSIGDTYHFQLLRRDPEIRKIEFLANTLSYVEYPKDSEVIYHILRSIGFVLFEKEKIYKK